ncbi:MAG TPA: hypothetical protein VME42_14865 [Steroidobacteraceae bacterium]|nr:hypothetical protein [Steroidobacteraceae bacterium]
MAGVMLAAFASRALIPAGFMPASDRPFSIEICWEGLPAEVLAQIEPAHAASESMGSMDMQSMDMGMPAGHSTSERGPRHGSHHHPGSPSHAEHCVFGTASSAGPIPHLPLPSEASAAQPVRAVAFASIAVAVRVVHLPQPRAPPGRLS